MTERKRKIVKKESEEDMHYQQEYPPEKFAEQYQKIGNGEREGSYPQYSEMPFGEHYQENIPENYGYDGSGYSTQVPYGYEYGRYPANYNEYSPSMEYTRRGGMAASPNEFSRRSERMLPSEHTDSDTSEEKKVKKSGRKKIKMEYIEGKNKRSVTFSKRKKGIMKKAYELNVLTGTQILLLVASESGHVYTFATPKLKPIISNHERLIQQCLNAPCTPEGIPYKFEKGDSPRFEEKDEYRKGGEYYQGYGNFYGGYEERKR
jgi:hypothetical protein